MNAEAPVAACPSAAPPPHARARARPIRRAFVERFVEVYVKASVEVCARRDPKGLYRRAFAGELTHFTGVSDPYEEPREPEIVLDIERHSPQQSAAAVPTFLDGRGGLLDEDP